MSPELTVQKYVSKDTLNGIVELLTADLDNWNFHSPIVLSTPVFALTARLFCK